MTKCGAGMTKWGAGMTKWGAGALGRPGWLGLADGPGSLAAPLTAPLDSGLRRNDEVGGAGMTKSGGRNDEVGRRNDEWGGRPAVRGWWLDGGLPHPSPPLWIPAFAGMTKWGGRNDEMGRRNDEVGGRNDDGGGPACCPWLVVAWPLADTSGWGNDEVASEVGGPSPPLWIPAFAGMTKWGAGMTKWGAGMTMVGGRPAVRGWWLGMTGVGAGRGCSGSGVR